MHLLPYKMLSFILDAMLCMVEGLISDSRICVQSKFYFTRVSIPYLMKGEYHEL